MPAEAGDDHSNLNSFNEGFLVTSGIGISDYEAVFF